MSEMDSDEGKLIIDENYIKKEEAEPSTSFLFLHSLTLDGLLDSLYVAQL
jgi:hypothetical protein